MGITDNKSSFLNEEVREGFSVQGLKRGLIGYMERRGIVSD